MTQTMNLTANDIERILCALTKDEQQLLKDTIVNGAWGDSEMPFANPGGEIDVYPCYCYCTNDAKRAGNFAGRKVGGMFRSIYRKLCHEQNHQVGLLVTHANDWWGDGSGDMLFIRAPYYHAFEQWACA